MSVEYVPDRRQPAIPPSTFPWWVLPGIASQVLAVFAGALIASCFIGNDTLQTQMFTGAYGLSNLVVGYFFGSSAGSARKDDAAAASAAVKDTTIARNSAALAVSAPVVTTTTKTEEAKPATAVDPAKPASTTTETKTEPVAIPVVVAPEEAPHPPVVTPVAPGG